MAIELLTNNHAERLLSAIQNCKKEICIISPFLSDNELTEPLINLLETKPISCTVVTRFEHEDFFKGASKIHALMALKSHHAQLFALKNLHAKLYLIDNSIAILGSANFTNGGLNNNHELSLYITEEPELLMQLLQYATDITSVCKHDGIITNELIQEEYIRLTKEPQNFQNSKYKYSYGATLPHTKKRKKIASQKSKKSAQPTVWIKFEATSRTRPNGKVYFLDKRFPAERTSFSASKKPRRIAEGDLVYIAVHSYDATGHPAPMIVACAKAHKFSENNFLSEKKEWPYYIELYDLKVLPGPLQDGLSLYTLIDICGKNTYKHTQTKGKDIDIKYSHRQQAYLELAEPAQNYLHEYFESKLE